MYTASQARQDTLLPMIAQNEQLIKSYAERGGRSVYAHFPPGRIEEMAAAMRQRGFTVQITQHGQSVQGLAVSW